MKMYMRRLLIIALAAVVGCTPPPSAKLQPFDADELGLPFDAMEAKLTENVAAHSFWRVPVTPVEVSDLLEKMRADGGDGVFVIDDHFNVAVRHGGDVQGAVSERCIEINMPDYDARPIRVRLLMKLKGKLDLAV